MQCHSVPRLRTSRSESDVARAIADLLGRFGNRSPCEPQRGLPIDVHGGGGPGLRRDSTRSTPPPDPMGHSTNGELTIHEVGLRAGLQIDSRPCPPNASSSGLAGLAAAVSADDPGRVVRSSAEGPADGGHRRPVPPTAAAPRPPGLVYSGLVLKRARPGARPGLQRGLLLHGRLASDTHSRKNTA